MLQKGEGSEGELHSREASRSGRGGDRLNFSVRLVLHIVYANAASAAFVGHKQHGYAVADIEHQAWFESKEAYLAAVCKAFERLWDEMKVGSARAKSEEADTPPA